MEADRVRVWFVRTDALRREVAACYASLDANERHRAAAMSTPKRRDRFVVAHGALRQITADHLGTDPGALRWERTDNGKPQLVGMPGAPHVNLSHSGDLAAVAISPREVGVDIERGRGDGSARPLSARFFGSSEADFVAAPEQPEEQNQRFLRLWTRKEACVKAVGGRLFQGLRLQVGGDCPVVVAGPGGSVVVRDVNAPPGFAAAVALRGTAAFEVVAAWWRPPLAGPPSPWSQR